MVNRQAVIFKNSTAGAKARLPPPLSAPKKKACIVPCDDVTLLPSTSWMQGTGCYICGGDGHAAKVCPTLKGGEMIVCPGDGEARCVSMMMATRVVCRWRSWRCCCCCSQQKAHSCNILCPQADRTTRHKNTRNPAPSNHSHPRAERSWAQNDDCRQPRKQRPLRVSRVRGARRVVNSPDSRQLRPPELLQRVRRKRASKPEMRKLHLRSLWPNPKAQRHPCPSAPSAARPSWRKRVLCGWISRQRGA